MSPIAAFCAFILQEHQSLMLSRKHQANQALKVV
jgi:hypothetical protein